MTTKHLSKLTVGLAEDHIHYLTDELRLITVLINLSNNPPSMRYLRMTADHIEHALTTLKAVHYEENKLDSAPDRPDSDYPRFKPGGAPLG